MSVNLEESPLASLLRSMVQRPRTFVLMEHEYEALLECWAALEELVQRCDGDAGVRADGSNIDTCRAHAALQMIDP